MEQHLSKSTPAKNTPAAADAALANGADTAADAAADAAMNQAAIAQAGADRAAGELQPMTVAEAARLVRRRKVIEAPGAQPRVIESAIEPDEVLAFKDHGTHVVVVTVDGQKFSTAD